MPTRVFLTVDTELKWAHHAHGLAPDDIVARSLDPAGVGIAYQLSQLRAHRLNACFFVDPMAALVFGMDPIRRVVGAILEAGQEVQLHLHPHWIGGALGDHGRGRSESDLAAYDGERQYDLLAQARALLVEAGAPPPIAFRAGNYAANDDTLRALARLGLRYDSSHNGACHPGRSKISLPPDQITPVEHFGIVEVPVTVIETRGGQHRQFQICALSSGEMRAALDHALAQGHPSVVVVSHSFELAIRAGTRPNAVHVRRFKALCRLLDARRDTLPTATFGALPPLSLDEDGAPLPADPVREAVRQMSQTWSNLVAERPRPPTV